MLNPICTMTDVNEVGKRYRCLIIGFTSKHCFSTSCAALSKVWRTKALGVVLLGKRRRRTGLYRRRGSLSAPPVRGAGLPSLTLAKG